MEGIEIDAKGEGKVSGELFEDGAPEDARIILKKRSGTACAMEALHKQLDFIHHNIMQHQGYLGPICIHK